MEDVRKDIKGLDSAHDLSTSSAHIKLSYETHLHDDLYVPPSLGELADPLMIILVKIFTLSLFHLRG